MRRLAWCPAAAVVALAACTIATPVLVSPTVEGPLFPAYKLAADSDYSGFFTGGSATIKGQAFLRTRGGEVRLGAGSTATLDPATPTATDWFGQVGNIASRFSELPAEPRFVKARRTTVIDAQGNFQFSGLAPGRYIVRSIVTWEVAGEDQGGLVADTVNLAPGETKSLILHDVVSEYTRPSRLSSGPPIVTTVQASARKFSVIRHITSSTVSCRGSTATTDLALATYELRRTAATANADAIVGVTCQMKTNLLDTSSCSTMLECEGDAIRWS